MKQQKAHKSLENISSGGHKAKYKQNQQLYFDIKFLKQQKELTYRRNVNYNRIVFS